MSPGIEDLWVKYYVSKTHSEIFDAMEPSSVPRNVMLCPWQKMALRPLRLGTILSDAVPAKNKWTGDEQTHWNGVLLENSDCWESCCDRIEWSFMPCYMVSVSGGKDSTAMYRVAIGPSRASTLARASCGLPVSALKPCFTHWCDPVAGRCRRKSRTPLNEPRRLRVRQILEANESLAGDPKGAGSLV